jgi:serine/threonine protein phosphatase PrpC
VSCSPVLSTDVTCNLLHCRSLGDLDFKEPYRYVECEPDVRRLALQPHRDTFVVLGSDGLWDVLSDTDAVITAARALKVCPELERVGVLCGCPRETALC